MPVSVDQDLLSGDHLEAALEAKQQRRRSLLQEDAMRDVFAEDHQAKQDKRDALLKSLSSPSVLLSDDKAVDIFAEEQEAKQDKLDALVDSLAKPKDLLALQNFLASDAAKKDKLEQLVNFLADPPTDPMNHDEVLLAETDVFADEQARKQKSLDDLIDGLINDTTALLATDDVDTIGTPSSFLSVMGGAVVLLVAVVVAVITKRVVGKTAMREKEDTQSDFGYTVMYE
ncbi:hypothetical protein PHYBOEH_010816 [Phytophthora boehmeriae]|uniref:Uncharacterized protein n=1 Tax=Phytophthora boehmeriae TaxID=109152 RepID=A0A8T1VL74_9STRA|nr:hypothetical protein PHYBOEH_010816 [Phytophthora boehmeriae]